MGGWLGLAWYLGTLIRFRWEKINAAISFSNDLHVFFNICDYVFHVNDDPEVWGL